MRQSKGYMFCFFIIVIFLCSINTGFAINEKVSNTVNISSGDNSTLEENETEPGKTDNWELSLVFYDSTVDGGTTPLTEINWDASDGGYEQGESRVITVQINYRNTNCVRDYAPGELEIKIDGLLKDVEECWAFSNGSLDYFDISWNIGANDSTHTGYDWNQNINFTNSHKKNIKNIIFQNADIIQSNSNFEGNISIVYIITPSEEVPEHFENSCIQIYNNILKAQIENMAESNEVFFNYKRNVFHPWIYKDYSVRKTANKITSYDGLPSDSSDYIWVKYTFSSNGRYENIINADYPYIKAKSPFIKDNIPKNCVVYDSNGNLLYSETNHYEIKLKYVNLNLYSSNIYVGYPKSIYNEENNNLNITNEVELWATYNNKMEPELLDTDSVNLNLANYEFNYSGDLYGIKKQEQKINHIYPMYYQDIINNSNTYKNSSSWNLIPTCNYSGRQMTVKIGDDILYCTTKDGTTEKLNDNDYYFKKIYIDNTKLVNGNNEKISKGKYDCELWIRYKNTNEYILYDSFKNGSKGKKGNYYEVGQSVYNFGKNDGVVGFFILIYDMEESLYSIVDSYYKTSFLDVDINFIKQDIPESGTLYNFDYLQIYFRDENGNLVLQNEPELNSYNNYITKEDIANYDIETYNCYLQRDVATKKWVYYKRSLDYADLFIEKTTQGNIIQDSINQKFTGTFKLETQVQTTNVDMLYKEQYDGSDAINGFKIYDLLPEGMNLTSTTDEIIENITFSEYFGYTSELNKLTPEYMMEITDFKINIIENWRDTNRTKLEIIVNFSKPIYFTGANWKCPFIIYYDYEISYDSYLEYGCDYTNTCYIHQLDGYKGGYYKNYSSEQLGKFPDAR